MKHEITGKVVSTKGDKTIIVAVETRRSHPVYKKQYKRVRRFMAHDQGSEARLGDVVTIRESRPLSGRKRFSLEQIVRKAEVEFETGEEQS